MRKGFVEVDMDTFYNEIGGLEHLDYSFLPVPYPYATEYIIMPARRVVGISEGHIPEGGALPKTRYYLPDAYLIPKTANERV